PPGGAGGVGAELGQPRGVVDPKRPQHDPLTAKLHGSDPSQRCEHRRTRPKRPQGHPGCPYEHAIARGATCLSRVAAEFVSMRLASLRRMKKRLDVLLVERGLAESRAQAQALVLAGLVPGHTK